MRRESKNEVINHHWPRESFVRYDGVVPTSLPTPTPSPKLTSPVTVTLNYSPIDHNFTLTVKGATEVSYLLKYLSKSDNVTTEQAVTHGGKADPQKIFTATHLAGTESSGAQVFHQISSGGLELTAKLPDKTETKIYKTFTISDKGVIKVTDVTAETLAGMVQGASTDSATLNPPTQPLMVTPMPLPVRTTVPTTMTDTTTAEITPTSAMPDMQKMMPFLAIVGGLLLLVILGLLLRRRFGRSTTPTPPPMPPQPPQTPLPPASPPVV